MIWENNPKSEVEWKEDLITAQPHWLRDTFAFCGSRMLRVDNLTKYEWKMYWKITIMKNVIKMISELEKETQFKISSKWLKLLQNVETTTNQ